MGTLGRGCGGSAASQPPTTRPGTAPPPATRLAPRRHRRWQLLPAASLLLLLRCADASPDASDLYCGRENCYGLLGLTRGATLSDVKKAFRKLALQWHPDKNKNPEAPARFRKIGRANEVLADERLRQAYDYFLDHPEDSYTHYYQYYHAVYTPKTPLWAVVLGTLCFLSGLQYLNQHWRYSSTMRAVRYQQSFRKRVNERLEAEVAVLKGKVTRAEREVLRDRIETQVLESEVQISGAGFSKPSLRALLLVRCLRLPWTLSTAAYKAWRWHYRFNVRKEAYGPEERAYLTRRALGMSEDRWSSMEAHQQEEFVVRELWLGDNLKAWHTEREEEMQQRLARSGAYKRANRWMKKNG